MVYGGGQAQLYRSTGGGQAHLFRSTGGGQAQPHWKRAGTAVQEEGRHSCTGGGQAQLHWKRAGTAAHFHNLSITKSMSVISFPL